MLSMRGTGMRWRTGSRRSRTSSTGCDRGPTAILGPWASSSSRRGRLAWSVELVADGTHVDPAVVREVVALAGRDGVALVTDAMAAAGMPDGSYRLGGADVIVSGAVARLRQGGGIAGGTAHLLDVVRTTVAGGVGIVDAVHMASSVPARVLGLADRGSLEVGRRADLVVTDAGLRPVLVLRGGSVAPERSEDPRLPAGVLS